MLLNNYKTLNNIIFSNGIFNNVIFNNVSFNNEIFNNFFYLLKTFKWIYGYQSIQSIQN